MTNSKRVVDYCKECGSPLYEGEYQCRKCGTWLRDPSQDQFSVPAEQEGDFPPVPEPVSVYTTSSNGFPLKIIAGLLVVAIGVLVFLIWQQGNTPRYELVLTNVTWADANEAAHQAGGQLAAPRNKKEMDSLVDLIKEKGMYPTKVYLGMARAEGTNMYFWLNKDDSVIYPAANSTASWSYDCWDSRASALTTNVGDDSKGILVVKDTFWNLDSVKDNALQNKSEMTVGYIIQY